MISEIYIYGYDTECGDKIYHHSPRKVYGNEPWEIDISEPDMTFEEMLEDEEMFIPHHLLEIVFSQKDLIKMGRYKNVKPSELIWIRKSTHQSNNTIHKNAIQKGTQPDHLKGFWKGRKRTEEDRKNRSLAAKKRANKLELKGFGLKFYKKFGKVKNEDPALYNRERAWYYTHNKKCRWE